MARQRTIPDELIVEAALALMMRLGPEALTLAEVGGLVDLSAATLLQRFGSKDNLKRVALEFAWDQLDAATAAADHAAPVTPEGAIAVIGALWPEAETSPDVAGGLLLLREDIRDPVLRARGAAWFEALAIALGRRLSADPERQKVLGRLMVSQWQGAQIQSAFSRERTARETIAAEMRQWLEALGLLA